MNGAATLFDADAPSHSATVEVLGVIFCAEDDGYAVLEVQDAESGEGFALVGPVAHLGVGERAEVSGDWQTHARYGRQLRAKGALPLDPADRAGRIAYLTSLRHIGPARAERLVDEHGEGVLGAIAADPGRSSARCAGSALPRRKQRPSPGTPAAPCASSTSSLRRTGWLTWRRRSIPVSPIARPRSCTRIPTG